MENDNVKSKNDGTENWQEKASSYLDNWKRAQADLVNYKKEELQRVEELVKFGSEGLILEILGILDGLEMVSQQFKNLLQKYGVEQITVAGQKFDPAIHEAVGVSAPSSDGTGLTEVRPGYTMHGRVIRPARVKTQ